MITLLEKLPNSRRIDAENKLGKALSSLTSGLDAKVTFVGNNPRNWVQLDIAGDDAKVAENFLRKKFGVAPSPTDVHLPMVLRGKIVDAGRVGYGVYVDVGFTSSSPMDVLITLHSLRSSLADGKKLSLREIREIFCLHDEVSISVRLTELDVEGKKIGGELSDSQLERFREWLSTSLDRVIVLGAPVEQIMLSLRKSGMQRDIAKVEELGFFEHALLCKLGTDAPGVIKALGRFLPDAPLYAFSPKKISQALGEQPSLPQE